VSAKMSNVTVKQILDVMLPMHGLAWEPDADSHMVQILPGDGKPVEDLCDPAAFLEPSELLEYEPLREKMGQPLPVFEVDKRPVREMFNLISRFCEGVNFILCPGIREDLVFMGSAYTTCGECLVNLMQKCDLVWKPVPGTSAIVIAPREREENTAGSAGDQVSPEAEVQAATQDVSEIVPQLNKVIEKLEVRDRPLSQVLNMLSRESGPNFVGGGPEADVTASFRNETVEGILNALSPKYGFRWDVFDDGRSILIGGYHDGPPRVIPSNHSVSR